MALQNSDMIEQADNMRKMIASGRILSQQIEQKSDVLFEAIAAAKTRVKAVDIKMRKNINVINTVNKNTEPNAAGLTLIETKKSGKRKIIF
ncbi:MAG: hypothetical protein ACYCYI_07495 [Saccharofermentanales bacterium]